jgi:hypothetical protein
MSARGPQNVPGCIRYRRQIRETGVRRYCVGEAVVTADAGSRLVSAVSYRVKVVQ